MTKRETTMEFVSRVQSPLMLRAYFAILGHSVDWRTELATMLRSGEPIDQTVRDRLADAIEGKTHAGTSLDLRGAGANRDSAVAFSSRQHWVEIGEWIQLQIASGIARKDAILGATAAFNSSHEKCEAALTYTRKCKRWVADFLLKDVDFAASFPERAAEGIYHMLHAERARKRKGRTKRGIEPTHR